MDSPDIFWLFLIHISYVLPIWHFHIANWKIRICLQPNHRSRNIEVNGQSFCITEALKFHEEKKHDWLVVSTLWNILVSWDDEIPYIWKNNKCSKPPTRWGTSAASESQSSHLCPQRAWWRHASAPHSGHGRRSERYHGSCFINPMERGPCLWKLKPHGWKSWFIYIYIPFGYLT